MPEMLGYAVVAADGAILHSLGVNNVNRTRIGHYEITFNFSVENACEVATICDSVAHTLFITAFGGVVGPNVVRVIVTTPSLFASDSAFQLLVVE
ncbi:hypothetical protein KSD_72340 [Ktedonobacter sp. SOSP1-85]|uniref:hypothetical protein n=1 Tax=Ktedonobacter sp. SOSP1-85 TaxID=2778367 RepID=UPI001915F013|nr:hypothetical protein [Ktedonobacter sp. SOSP1-85]GHO79463.1 hypothetical protein KSD_72340 [Ktedonobacter sp. SOSP1-85]